MYLSQEREFFFPVDIIEQTEKLGITLAKLKDMVRHSTRITHPFGNRRYENYLFMVEGDRVLGFGTVIETEAGHQVDMVAFTGCKTCMGTKRVPTFDQCDKCGGTGCAYCDQGLVPSSIPCPDC